MNSNQLQDTKVNVKIVIAALWTAQFLLWTFGDMVALLQETAEPIASELLFFVAAPLAVIQALMILFSLIGRARVMRWANMIVVLLFVAFNVGYLAEATAGWQVVLGSAYLLFDVLIISYAWRWPRLEGVAAAPEAADAFSRTLSEQGSAYKA